MLMPPSSSVDTLLYEGYALYPYTPGATKNATPTPFGIVYPPVYAAGSGSTFDHLQIECEFTGDAVSGQVHFLQASGVRHQGEARRVDLPAVRDGEERSVPLDFDGLFGRALIRSRDGRMTIRVENHTPVEPGLDRAAALRHALLSTHVVGRRRRRALRLAARGRRLRERQLVAGARDAGGRRRARRRDHAPRPPADRAREQGQPVRLDRDRGGAADPRARACPTTSARRRRRRTRRCGRCSSAPRRRRRRS